MGARAIVPASASHLCIGLNDACAIADYLLKKINCSELPWQTANQLAIAILKEVGKEIDRVGKLEEFGFDIIFFLDERRVFKKMKFREDSSSIGVKVDITENDVFSEFICQEIESGDT